MSRIKNILKKATPLALKKMWWKHAPQREPDEIKRLRRMKRFQETTTTLLGPPTKIVDADSFLYLYENIISRQMYRFESSSTQPLIIDGGANIGVSILYFKQLYPLSRVIAFEPDTYLFRVLQENCETHGVTEVRLVNKALWSKEGNLAFQRHGADAGRLCDVDGSRTEEFVEVTRLRAFLTEQVDFLKLDIEGAETEVLADCRDLLAHVERLFVEYHSSPQRPQSLRLLIEVLEAAGFRLHIESGHRVYQPFVSRPEKCGYDVLLDIFGYRPTQTK